MKPSLGKIRAKVTKGRFSIVPFMNPGGDLAYRVAGYKPNAERIRENFATEEEAVGRKAELDIEAANIVTTTATRLKNTRLTDEQVKDAERAVAKLGDGFPKKTLLDAVEYFLSNYREPIRQIRVADAVSQFITDRAKQNRRPDTLRNLRSRLGMFSRTYGNKYVAELTIDDCRDFVFRKGTSPRNQINDRLTGSNFLNWCMLRQFSVINPMKLVDKSAVDAHEPSILSLADCRSLLVAARDYKEGLLLPYTVLSLFAGLRPTETARLSWDRVDLTDGTITLDGKTTKTRQRRIVKLPDNAIAWLLPMAPRHPKFVPPAFPRHFAQVKIAAGFKGKKGEKAKDGKPALRPWIQDYLRHTALSMYLAKYKHEGEAASWAGNSPNVIHRHYKGLVKEADATEFWSITPETVGGGIVQFPHHAAA